MTQHELLSEQRFTGDCCIGCLSNKDAEIVSFSRKNTWSSFLWFKVASINSRLVVICHGTKEGGKVGLGWGVQGEGLGSASSSFVIWYFMVSCFSIMRRIAAAAELLQLMMYGCSSSRNRQ